MIVELRQYTLHPGKRDVLMELFGREFVTGQEDAGMKILGWYQDLDDPDRFVWLRAFASMQERAESLTRFYFGPVWQAHRDVANATMIDSDDVLLLQTQSLVELPSGRLTATLFYFDGPVPQDFAADVAALARFETLHAENTFPQLPIRTGENVLVLITTADTDLPQGEASKIERLRLSTP
jgi:hypothetical protein